MTSGRCQVLAWAWPAATPPAELLGAAFELCLNELSAGPHVNESSLETVINYRAAPAPEAGTHLAGLPPGQWGWRCCSGSASQSDFPFWGEPLMAACAGPGLSGLGNFCHLSFAGNTNPDVKCCFFRRTITEWFGFEGTLKNI